MKYEPIDGGLKQLKENLSRMTFKQKLNHLWTYYKGSLVVLAVAIALCSIFVTSCRARNTRTLIAGIGINVILTDEGTAVVKDGYFNTVTQGGLEQVIYTETIQDNFATTNDLTTSYTALMNLLAFTSTEELDYLLLDDVAVQNLLVHGIFLDLREFFTEAELEELGDKVIWMEATDPNDSKVLMPVAVNVEHIPFIQEHAKNIKDTYFAVVSNTPRKDACRNFWQYLNSWTPAT